MFNRRESDLTINLKHMKFRPLDFVVTPKGAFVLITEISDTSGSSIEFIGEKIGRNHYKKLYALLKKESKKTIWEKFKTFFKKEKFILPDF